MVGRTKSTNGRANGKKRVLRPWSKGDQRELRGHSKAKTPVAKDFTRYEAHGRCAAAARSEAPAVCPSWR